MFNRIQTISNKDFSEKLEEWSDNDILIDVRTKEEVDEGIINKAQHISLDELEERIEKIKNHSAIYLICYSGARAETAARILKKHYCINVTVIKGGMRDWKNDKLPITKE